MTTPAEAARTEAHRIARATLRELLNLRARIDEEIVAAREELEQTRRGVKPSCGTEKGYQWHRHDKANWPLPKDDPCGCRAAHNANNRRDYVENDNKSVDSPLALVDKGETAHCDGRMRAQNNGPRRCANTVIQGPRRTTEEFD